MSWHLGEVLLRSADFALSSRICFLNFTLCKPLIWVKDCGPHQDGVEIWKFAREVDATDDDFQPIEDDDWLNELYKVSPWLNIHDNQR
jgi:hypothetical protein